MDKIDKLIKSEGDRFVRLESHVLIYFEVGYFISDFKLFEFEYICTVGEYKERLNENAAVDLLINQTQKNKESMIVSPDNIDELNDELRKKFLLETYTGLAMQALIARGESKSGVKSLSREFAQAAIDSLNGVCDENTTE